MQVPGKRRLPKGDVEIDPRDWQRVVRIRTLATVPPCAGTRSLDNQRLTKTAGSSAGAT
jgi:hypothetical protein